MITEYKNEIIVKGQPLKIDITKLIIEKENNNYNISCQIEYYINKQMIQTEYFIIKLDSVKYGIVSTILSRSTNDSINKHKKIKVELYKNSRQKFVDKFFNAVLADDMKKIICSCSLI